MITSVAPAEVAALLAAGELDVVDVRDPRDWAAGHLPGARNVPLDDLKADPAAHLHRPRVLMVCARGVRSLTAAKAAERLGLAEVYSLDGGMLAWAEAGLPVQAEAVPSPGPATTSAPVGDAGCGLPAPGPGAVVGANLRALRAERQLSLDALARLTGLSRTLLGQLELGKGEPSVAVVWQLARAFDVPFSTMLVTAAPSTIAVQRGATATRLASPDGRFSSRALFPLSDRPEAEFYELYLAPHSREDAHPHQPGTRENLIVVAGRLELSVGAERFELARGDAILFAADVAHAYVNPDRDPCWIHLVMTYARAAAP